MVNLIFVDTKGPIYRAYTSINSYHHAQLLNLEVALHKRDGFILSNFLEAYGEHLVKRLATSHLIPIKGITNYFKMLLNIKSSINNEVNKLYPTASPSTFMVNRLNNKIIWLICNSYKNMTELAERLMHLCHAHFGENFNVNQILSINNSHAVKFKIKRV